MPDHYDIAEIKDRITIASLFERDGRHLRRTGTSLVTLCPFHDEKTPSCHIYPDKDTYHCYGCGAGGDIFSYWQNSRDIDFKEALPDLASIAGIGATEYTPTSAKKDLHKPRKTTPKPALPAPLAGQPLADWTTANQSLAENPAEQHRIAQWRGYPPDLIRWATQRGIIGTYTYYRQPREAFLVEMPTPSLTSDEARRTLHAAEQDPKAPPLRQTLIPVSAHIRLSPHTPGNDHPKQSWRFSPTGCGSWPIIFGDHTTAPYLYITEGQWDALALIGLMGWHTRYPSHPHTFPRNIAVIGLRGATSCEKLLTHYHLRPDATAFCFADADTAGTTWFFTPCRQCPHHPKNTTHTPTQPHTPPTQSCTECAARTPSFIEQLQEKIAAAHGIQPATPGMDLNDLIRAGHLTADHIRTLVSSKLTPAHRTRPTGPTLYQWCRSQRNTATSDPALTLGIAHILADKDRPPGRQPHRIWTTHWHSQNLPENTLHALQHTWSAWENHTRTNEPTQP